MSILQFSLKMVGSFSIKTVATVLPEQLKDSVAIQFSGRHVDEMEQTRVAVPLAHIRCMPALDRFVLVTFGTGRHCHQIYKDFLERTEQRYYIISVMKSLKSSFSAKANSTKKRCSALL